MKFTWIPILFAMALVSIPAHSCPNEEADISSSTTYGNTVVCRGVVCGTDSYKTWEYACAEDEGTGCVDDPNQPWHLNTVYVCGSECGYVTYSDQTTGKKTVICP